jgi:hypothetical protein
VDSPGDHAHAIRTPINKVEEYKQLNRIRDDFRIQNKGRDPTMAELATELGTTEEKVTELIKARNAIISLDKKVGDSNDGKTLVDLVINETYDPFGTIGEGENPLFEIARMTVPNVLTSHEYEIIQARYFSDEPATFEELAVKSGVTREAVRQQQLRAIAKLKHPSVVLASNKELEFFGGSPEPWRDAAACRGMVTETFFGRRLPDSVQSICARCAVRLSCLAYAEDNNIKPEYWGGTSAIQRKQSTKPQS